MPNFIDPDKQRFGLFKDLPRVGKIHMLNLLKFRDMARYEDGTMVTGQEAYAAYGRESGPIFRKVGGKIIWSGKSLLTLIGPEDENWDISFIAEYPNADAFISMIRDADYQKAVRHRQAAVETSRLIRLEPSENSGDFG